MRYKLRDDLKFKLNDSTLELYIPYVGTYQFKQLKVKDIAKLKKLQTESIDLEADEINHEKSIFHHLLKAKAIYQAFNISSDYKNRTLSWFTYRSTEPQKAFQNFTDSKICILGCGGIGANIFQMFLQAGAKKFILIDDSILDEPDLNRQNIYGKKDIGKHKVELCAEFAKSNFETEFVHTHKLFIDNSKSLKSIIDQEQPTIIFSCIDKPSIGIQAIVTNAIIDLDIPIIFGGVGSKDGSIGPLLTCKKEKEKYISLINSIKKVNTNAQIINGSISFTNSLISSYIAHAGFIYLLEKKRFCQSFEMKVLNFASNEFSSVFFNQ